MKVRTLSSIRRPSRTARTIVAKSSSVSTTSPPRAPRRCRSRPSRRRHRPGGGRCRSPHRRSPRRRAPDCHARTRRSLSAGVTRANVSAGDRRTKRVVVERRELGPRERLPARQVECLRDRRRRQRVIPRQHRDVDALHPVRGAATPGRRAKRIAEGDETDQLDLVVETCLLRSGVDPAFGDGEDPEPLRRPPIEPALEIVSQLGGDVAALEQQLGAPLTRTARAVWLAVDGCLPFGRGRTAPRGQAADARGAWVVARLGPQGEQECAVDRVAGDAKPVAVVDERRRRGENTRLEDVGAASAGARVDVRDTELVDGERAGLVGRDQRGGAERLDRAEPARTIAPREVMARAPEPARSSPSPPGPRAPRRSRPRRRRETPPRAARHARACPPSMPQ